MRVNVIAFSTNGCRTAMRVRDALSDRDIRIFSKTSSDTLGVEGIDGKLDDWVKGSFEECDAIVFIGALGIAVRHIAPFIRNKTVDPAVIGMDEHGKWVIPLLSGHIGGANELSETIADRLGSQAIVTTATDINGRFSVDVFATKNDLRISNMVTAKTVSARVLDGRFVGLHSDIPIQGDVPSELTVSGSGEFGICISPDHDRKPFDVTLNLIPMDIVLGVGCRRGTDPGKMQGFVMEELGALGIDRRRVSRIASIDLKSDEVAILDLARVLRTSADFHTADELNELVGDFTSSDFVKDVTTVDCVCERAAVRSGGVDFLLRKRSRDGMTLAICSKPVVPRFT